MPARQPTIVATSIGFQPEGPDPANLRPGPSYRLAADLAGAGEHPRVCMIATAVGDDATRLAAAHNAFSKLGFISSHLTLFPMPNVPDVRAHLLAPGRHLGGRRQHGQSAGALAPARARRRSCASAGRRAWCSRVSRPARSAGTSAAPPIPSGRRCSRSPNGLAFLPYSNSPHHDAEEQRRPLIHRLIAEGVLPDGYATENGTGLVFFGTELAGRFHRGRGQGGVLIDPRRRHHTRNRVGDAAALARSGRHQPAMIQRGPAQVSGVC